MESNFPKNRSFTVLFALVVILLVLLNIDLAKFSITNKITQLSEGVVHLPQSSVRLISESASEPADPSAILEKAVDPASFKCLAENIYFEASNQSLAGKMGVGHVVLNRVNSPSYPKTVCGVVKQRSPNGSCQFSWVCDGKSHTIKRDSEAWKQSKLVAHNLLAVNGEVNIDITEGATHYHADYVKPAWRKRLIYVARIDNHMFYKDED